MNSKKHFFAASVFLILMNLPRLLYAGTDANSVFAEYTSGLHSKAIGEVARAAYEQLNDGDDAKAAEGVAVFIDLRAPEVLAVMEWGDDDTVRANHARLALATHAFESVRQIAPRGDIRLAKLIVLRLQRFQPGTIGPGADFGDTSPRSRYKSAIIGCAEAVSGIDCSDVKYRRAGGTELLAKQLNGWIEACEAQSKSERDARQAKREVKLDAWKAKQDARTQKEHASTQSDSGN